MVAKAKRIGACEKSANGGVLLGVDALVSVRLPW